MGGTADEANDDRFHLPGKRKKKIMIFASGLLFKIMLMLYLFFFNS